MSEMTAAKDFVLLSTIAKERKYAQEYLSLLARRGDLGSVRIGKRWYTKIEWFEEFLVDVEKRKEEARIKTNEKFFSELKPEKDIIMVSAEAGVIQSPRQIAEKQIKTNSAIPFQEQLSAIGGSKNEKKGVKTMRQAEFAAPQMPNRRFDLQRPIDVAMKPRKYTTSRIHEKQQPVARPVQQPSVQITETPENNLQEVLDTQAEIQRSYSRHNFSPSFFENNKKVSLLFPRLAFSAALVLLLAVLSGGVYLYKKDTSTFPGSGSGVVAGAEDVRLAGVSSFGDKTSSYLETRKGLTKQNISLSRVVLEAAIEKNP
jgi:hypothetical protein